MTILSAPSPAAPRRRMRKALGILLSSGGMIGLGLTLGSFSQRGEAQGFLGNYSFPTGFATISSGKDIITAETPTVVIEWVPDDMTGTAPIDFLPAANSALFQNGSNVGNFTVLNNIRPSNGNADILNRIIELNGTITSQPGNNVWFYTPGGFLIGDTARINVGGLVLSTSQIDETISLAPLAPDGFSGTVSFTGTPTTASRITISPLASISAANYVAMVAPRIDQRGTVTVDGSAAYVAAEQATITMNGGLFDIVVTDGSGDANGIVHDGTTTGPASTASSDTQRIYMVAVPKNQAMTMLLSGSIGYTAAASAVNEGSAVVLSAGYDIFSDDSAAPSSGAGTGGANIAVSGTTSFSNATTAYALDAITLNAGAGEQIGAASDLILYAQREGQGGLISFTASDTGSISVDGNLIAGASGFGSSSSGTSDGTGGTVQLTANGGTIAVTGDTGLFASGFANSSLVDGDPSGAGAGGTITLATGSGGGALSFADLTAQANGNETSPVEPFINTGGGGNGTGGTIVLTLPSGTLTAGAVTLSADGTGFASSAHDSSLGTAPFLSGDGFGGSISFAATGGSATVTTLTAHADGYGGLSSGGDDSFAPIGSIAGDGQGGTVSFSLSGTGGLTATDITASASGLGGLGGSSFEFMSAPPPLTTVPGEDGGDGVGGNVIFALSGGALSANMVKLGANGLGGDGGESATLGSGGAGGAGTGGSADFNATSGTHDIGPLTVEALGTGGTGGAGRYEIGFDPITGPIYAYDAANGGAGGAGRGGAASLSGGNGATASSLTMDASGQGGTGGDGLTGGNGGGATNGLARADFLAGATFAFGSWTTNSLATGGTGGASPSGGTAGATGGETSDPSGGIAVSFADGSAANGTSAIWTSDSGIAMGVAGTGLLTLSGNFTTEAFNSVSIAGIVTNGVVSADGSDISITTPADIAFDHATASAGDFTLNSGGTASFIGDATATNISVTSADLSIGAGANLIATGTLSLTNGGSSRTTYIGGADTSLGYSLSAAEIARLFASGITVIAPAVGGITTLSLGSTRSPDLIIGDMTVQTGTGRNLPATGNFTIATPGKARITGAVSFTGLTTGGLTIQADDALEIIAGSGSIDLRDGNGALGGTLQLFSDDIIAASGATIDAVGAAGSLFERNNLLDVNDGAVNDQGYLRAGNIAINVANGLYIQNSGAGTDTNARRGFTANSLSITTQGDAEIVINGRLTDPNGGFATGLTALGRVVINDQAAPASGYAAGSTINGCLIISPAACIPNMPDLNIPVRNEDIKGELDPEAGSRSGPGGDMLPTVIIEIKEFEQMGFPPLIDEPVTGSGNDDLWTGADCSASDGGECRSGVN